MSLLIDKVYKESEKLWIVSLQGEVDIDNASELKEVLMDIAKEGFDIKIDASKLEYIDSTGLGILIGALKRLKEKQRDIYISNPKNNVRKLFLITGLDKIFKLEG
ncbi:anti-sigma B factor antagonist [Alkalithermobacter thermoalcaliphilus JW-YL-7 = DSM 7308]|uniref:Anti-sigma factor antagonist n=1 Tax=Alkalithermobacter thermoalcaliphilus JW-YL-7 = DSM 7308 TaxID=1121328 RepID=A0A150FUQ3_CLOPD|nr:anti-anti-sigma regulatory factor, SpoIIAA [[Clostridium] paradoxum JW-YL-7 = DSM 7308]SHL08198.1 anti-sigma B factor antagonist [[Clostridium] paradoxum JW-YL-7 = DSM 7308]